MDENITLTSNAWCDGARIELEEFRVDVLCLWVRGYHIYKDIWYAVVCEVLVYERKPNNFQDRYAVDIKKFRAFNFRA